MQRRTKVIGAAALAVAALICTGAGVAVAQGGDDDEQDVPITGAELDRASTVALEHTGGGRVTETEKGDEEGAYEVEVTLEDGTQVDVHLDSNFHVIGDDSDSGGDNESGGNDD
jgi:uncharacterized membrane protein YkoI